MRKILASHLFFNTNPCLADLFYLPAVDTRELVSIQKSRISGWRCQPSALSAQPNPMFFIAFC
jgi:hypothetical protein